MVHPCGPSWRCASAPGTLISFCCQREPMKRFSFSLLLAVPLLAVPLLAVPLLAVSLVGCPSGDTPTERDASEAGSGDEPGSEAAADEAEAAPEAAEGPADEPVPTPAAEGAPGAANTAEGSGRDALIRAANPSRVQLVQPQLRLEARGLGRELRLAPNAVGSAASPTLQLQPAGE
jgi:hypothetical protein